MTNIVENPNVGLLFIIPGYNDTLRVNVMAKIVNDETLMTNSEIKGRIPKVGILIDVRETFFFALRQSIYAFQALGFKLNPGSKGNAYTCTYDPRSSRCTRCATDH